MESLRTLTIQYASDLHLETSIKPNKPITTKSWMHFLRPSADILILAGDTCPVIHPQFIPFIQQVCQHWRWVLFIAGNHEYYHTSIEPANELLERLDVGIPNFVFLHNKVFIIGEVCFIGSTLWSHIPDEHRGIVHESLNDYSLIHDYTIDVNNKLFEENKNFLETALNDHNNYHKVVITHHTPLMDGTSAKCFDGKPTNCAFSTDLPELVRKADVWVCGHTHHCNTIQYEKCTVLLNCKGYGAGGTRRYNNAATFSLTYQV